MAARPSLAVSARTGDRIAPIERGWLLSTAAVAMLALVLTSGRYGYHRDELYFIAAGAHPAWGYPDQPLLAPLLARAMDLLAPGSLLVLRAPAILACGMTTITIGLLAREAGGGRRAQRLRTGPRLQRRTRPMVAAMARSTPLRLTPPDRPRDRAPRTGHSTARHRVITLSISCRPGSLWAGRCAPAARERRRNGADPSTATNRRSHLARPAVMLRDPALGTHCVARRWLRSCGFRWGRLLRLAERCDLFLLLV